MYLYIIKLIYLYIVPLDFRDRRAGINEAVSEEVVSVFKGKTTKQLQLLEEQMRRKLAGGEGVDVGIATIVKSFLYYCHTHAILWEHPCLLGGGHSDVRSY